MKITRGVLMLFVCACLAHAVQAQTTSLPKIPSLGFEEGSYPLVKPVRGTALIDGENNIIRVIGYGTCDPEEIGNDAECISTAYAVARAQAMRNLAEIVGELKINEDLDLRDIYKINNETVVESNAILRQVRPKRGQSPNGIDYRGYQYMPDNSIVAWVTLEMQLDTLEIGKGLDNPNVLDMLEKRLAARSQELRENPIRIEPPPVDEEVVEPVPTATENQNYTGLIIDTSAHASTSILVAPAVLGASGRRVYDLNKVKKEVRLSGQLIRPSPTMEKARRYTDKVGPNPLVVAAATVDKGDIILSDEDAEKVQRADEKGKFLYFGRVIVVY